MKKEFLDMEVSIYQNTGFVTAEKCSHPAGNSGYRNDIIPVVAGVH